MCATAAALSHEIKVTERKWESLCVCVFCVCVCVHATATALSHDEKKCLRESGVCVCVSVCTCVYACTCMCLIAERIGCCCECILHLLVSRSILKNSIVFMFDKFQGVLYWCDSFRFNKKVIFDGCYDPYFTLSSRNKDYNFE